MFRWIPLKCLQKYVFLEHEDNSDVALHGFSCCRTQICLWEKERESALHYVQYNCKAFIGTLQLPTSRQSFFLGFPFLTLHLFYSLLTCLPYLPLTHYIIHCLSLPPCFPFKLLVFISKFLCCLLFCIFL